MAYIPSESERTVHELMARVQDEMGREFASTLSEAQCRVLVEHEDDVRSEVHVLFAMTYPIGRGLASVMDVLGLDHEAACAELEAS